MPLSGSCKREYQREYMRKKRFKSVEAGSNKAIGSNKAKADGATDGPLELAVAIARQAKENSGLGVR